MINECIVKQTKTQTRREREKFSEFSLLLLLSTMASCVETFEVEVMHLCLFTSTDKIVVFQLSWKSLRIEIVNYEAFHFLMRLCF